MFTTALTLVLQSTAAWLSNSSCTMLARPHLLATCSGVMEFCITSKRAWCWIYDLAISTSCRDSNFPPTPHLSLPIVMASRRRPLAHCSDAWLRIQRCQRVAERRDCNLFDSRPLEEVTATSQASATASERNERWQQQWISDWNLRSSINDGI